MTSVGAIAALLGVARDRLGTHPEGSGDAVFDSQLLLCSVLDRDRGFLYAHPEFRPSREQISRFNALIARRANGEPIAYLTGRREFWSLDLQVNPATLIPRHETETLVEQCLPRIPADADWAIADLGTGSGAIALALASERPACRITASDRSATALQTAAGNARRLGLDNVRFVRSDWFQSLVGQRFDLIASNPPYIADHDPHLRLGDVAHEPRSALASGNDGLDDIREIIIAAPRHLRPSGWLLMEHGYDQGNKILDLLRATGYDEAIDYPDLAGQPRVVAARYRS